MDYLGDRFKPLHQKTIAADVENTVYHSKNSLFDIISGYLVMTKKKNQLKLQ